MRKRIRRVLFISGFAMLLVVEIVIVLFQLFRAEFDDQKIMNEFHTQNIFPISEIIPYGDNQIHSN